MFFYPRKGAFRAGYVSGDHWNDSNIGDQSFASGTNTVASGTYSTAMGAFTIAPSTYETVIGSYNTVYSPSGNLTDRLFTIGNGISGNNRSDALILQKNGNITISGQAYKPGGGGWTATSDQRLKKEVRSYSDGLDKVLSINPVYYHYNELSGNDTSKEHIGVIAQELEKTAPYMVGTFKQNGTEYLNVDNSAMTYMLINAVKDQHAMIKEQQATIEKQNSRIEQLEQTVNSLMKNNIGKVK